MGFEDAGIDAASDADASVADASVDVNGRADADAQPTNCPAFTDAGQPVLADSRSGFSSAQGGCGWSYLYWHYDNTEYVEAPMLPFYNAERERWQVQMLDASTPWYLSRTGAHPGTGVAMIRRWRGAHSGRIRAFGRAALAFDGGDGTRFLINHEGASEPGAAIGVDIHGDNFDATIDSMPNAAIDFVLYPNENSLFDTTLFTVTIAERP